MSALLTVNSIDVFHGSTQALWDVTLNIKQGEIISIVGSNGAGKTTLLKSISGVLKPKKGNIHYQGKRIDKKPPQAIWRMGISHVPEGRRIFTKLRVVDNLFLGVSSSEAKAKRDDTLQYVFNLFPVLKERVYQRAGTLSGGEAQMLAVGRALMNRPSLLLMDEPSLGIAPKIVSTLFQTIRQLNLKDGLTIMLVEQNVSKGLELANRAYVLESGRIVMQGEATTLAKDERIRRVYLGTLEA